MDRELLDQLRQCGNDERTIEIIEEGISTIQYELRPLFQKLKQVDKQYAINMLEEYILLLNDLTALCVTHMTKKSTTAITCDQALLIGSLTGTLNTSQEQRNKE